MANHNIINNMSFKEIVTNISFITLGALLMAFTIDSILLPYDIIDGGVTGISMITSSLTGIPLGILLFGLNLPFIYLGYKKLGKYFTIFTIYGIGALSLFTSFIHKTGFVVGGIDTFLAAVVGGAGLGVAVGIILRMHGAADGVDVLAVIINKKFGLSVGNVIMIVNIFVFTVSIFTHDISTAFYSMITYFIAKNVIDLVVEGTNDSRTFMISSTKVEEIGNAIKKELDVNFTYFKTVGSHSKDDKMMLYIAVNQLEEVKLKRIIQIVDKNAFYVVGIAQEHRGKIKF